jgi:hypothetical protein
MTGFDSKRSAAQDKLTDEADTLTIVYQRGFADGKKAAQGKPLTNLEIWQMVNDCTIGGDLHADKFARAIEAAHNIKEQP